mgnify:FL=1|jgi:5-formyltetrahydrofolate cyclo-ligase|tara:strand:- start:1664 stop:2260 length:597 start_codon:yes stop_codon:yes gene_type:complete
MIEEERRNLRYTLRQARRKLTEVQQARAADHLRELVTNQDFYRKALQIAFYQSVDGEIDPTPLLKQALSEGKSCCLPTIPDKNSELISFARFNEDTVLRKNRWGIYEPAAAKDTVSPTEFDLVFVPLVGFDADCFRLGMGKGFYDRTFSFKVLNRQNPPMLIGLAHKCQLTESLPLASWDVRLDAVITSEKIYRPDAA